MNTLRICRVTNLVISIFYYTIIKPYKFYLSLAFPFTYRKYS